MEGVSEEDLHDTLTVLKDLVNRANLAIKLIQPVPIDTTKLICQVRIELEASSENCGGQQEGRVLFLGGSGSGKTTLLSVLGDWGSRDDGRGKMRTRLLHHRHELLTGTTSSVTHQPLVFLNSYIPVTLTDDSVLLHLERRKEILGNGMIVQLIDSAGTLRFNRTVFSVLTSAAHPPSLAFLVLEAPISSSQTIPEPTIDTFRLLERLDIPVALLISKVDQSSTEAISHLLEEFATLFPHKNLSIYDESEGDAWVTDGLPVILSSAVNGDFLPSLCHFIYSQIQAQLPSPGINTNLIHAQESASSALIIEQVAQIADIGTVVYGQVAFGTIWVGDEMLLGPMERDNESLLVRVKSIQRLKCPVNSAAPTQHVSLALQFLSTSTTTSIFPTVRKGMTVLKLKPSAHLTLKPLKRIIAEVEQLTGSMQQRFMGVLFVMGQRFPATLDLQPLVLRRSNSTTMKSSVGLVTFSEKRPATVFLFPSASIIFIGNGKKEMLVGKVIDYFA